MSLLLLVEDDENLGSTLRDRLSREGYEVEWAKSRSAASACLRAGNFDLCLLDIGLPDGSGLDLAREIKLERNMPIVFLTAANSADHRLEGYELGAEEFIPKPFFVKELLLRIERVIKRSKQCQQSSYGRLHINWDKMSLSFYDGSEEFPAAKDFMLLSMLVKASPRVLPREEIVKELWSDESSANLRSIDNAISRLRHLLRRGEADFIRSVRGVGYQWLPDGGADLPM